MPTLRDMLTAVLNRRIPDSTFFTGTITVAKLTPGGANGSMTFASGILTASTPAT